MTADMDESVEDRTRRRKITPLRGVVIVGVVLGTAAVAASFAGVSMSNPLSGSKTTATNFTAKAGTRLSGSYFEAGVVQGGVEAEIGPRQIRLSVTNQKVYAKKAAKFEVDGVNRVVSAPAGTYDLYVRYQGEDGRELLLRNCRNDIQGLTYCPTGTFIKIDNGQSDLIDISNQLLSVQTAPIGVANRQIVNLFDPVNQDKFWLGADDSKLAAFRLYRR